MPNHTKYFLRPCRLFACLIFLQICTAGKAAAADISVLASVKPLQSLAMVVSKGVFEPQLLIDNAASPHSFQLKPSQVRRVSEADVILWAGEGVERFLPPLIKKLAPTALSIELAELPDVITHHSRSDEHDHKDIDYHLWLEPRNALVLVEHLALQFALIDPDHADHYRANADKFKQELSVLTLEIENILGDVKGKQYLVYHDSLQYFEKAFGLGEAMVVTAQPQLQAGAKRLKALRDEVALVRPGCIFSEPQFRAPALKTLASDLKLQTGTIDPLASNFPSDAVLYFNWMKQTAVSFADCLQDSQPQLQPLKAE